MQQNKEAGLPNWFHPGSLTSGGRFSNTSACSRAVQAAYGMLACDCHDKTGGRQAECFRWLWTCTGVGGVLEEFEPPVWTLGLAGLFGDFQDAQSTGFHMIDWHCKVRSLLAAANHQLFAVLFRRGAWKPMATRLSQCSTLPRTSAGCVDTICCSSIVLKLIVPCPALNLVQTGFDFGNPNFGPLMPRCAFGLCSGVILNWSDM